MNMSKYWESLHPAPHPAASSYPRRDGTQLTKNCATGARGLKRRLLQIVTECTDSSRRSSAYSSRLRLGACGYLRLYLGSCGESVFYLGACGYLRLSLGYNKRSLTIL